MKNFYETKRKSGKKRLEIEAYSPLSFPQILSFHSNTYMKIL